MCTEKRTLRRLCQLSFGMTLPTLSFKYLGPKPSLKDKVKLYSCAHEGAAATHSVEEFCDLGEDNHVADPFCTSQVSDLAPHLSLPI